VSAGDGVVVRLLEPVPAFGLDPATDGLYIGTDSQVLIVRSTALSMCDVTEMITKGLARVDRDEPGRARKPRPCHLHLVRGSE